MALQQNRILRFLMILTAVLLTIFIYASYYSNTVLTLPSARLHASSAASSAVVADPSILLESLRDNSIDDNIIVIDKQNREKHPQQLQSGSGDLELNNSIDARTYLDENGLSSASAAGSASSTTFAENSVQNRTQNKLTGAIINANATTNSSHSAASMAAIVSPSATLNTTVSRSVPVSIASSSHSSKAKNKTTTVAVRNDPLKGVRTRDIYEPGHDDTNPQLCPNRGDTMKLLVVITSAPKNQEARLAIRQTWGHYGTRRDVAIAFAVGQSTATQIEDSLMAEYYLYGDLIRGHFIDSYNNLTLKTISILEWVDQNCPLVGFTLKTDDDMFINVAKLLLFIDAHRNDKRTIYGRLAKKWRPIRNQKSKYYVSPGQFQSAVFPQFTTGPAYLMTADTIHDLYMKSLEQTYLKLEDVYTTGIVAQLLNIKRVHVNEFLNRRIAFNPCHIRKAISVHMVKSNEQFDLWKKLLDTSAKCK